MKYNSCPQTIAFFERSPSLFHQATEILENYYFVVLAYECESSSPRRIQPVVVVHIHGSRHPILPSCPYLDQD